LLLFFFSPSGFILKRGNSVRLKKIINQYKGGEADE